MDRALAVAPSQCLCVNREKLYLPLEGSRVSIVRVGLSETKKFSEGYEAIFGRKPVKTKKSSEKSGGRAKKKKGKKK